MSDHPDPERDDRPDAGGGPPHDETDPAARDEADLDPGADTAMFQAFVDEAHGPTERGRASGVAFRLATLAGGLVLFVAIVWLLLR